MSATGPPSSRCLSPDEVELFATGATMDEAADRHLKSCAMCRASVERAALSNSFISQHLGALRAGMKSPPAPIGAAAATPNTPTPTPSTREAIFPAIPGLRLLARVSEGGQGVVFKGVQIATRRKVAVKMLRHGLLATERQLHRFEREAELLASLRHPNIVAVHDCGRTPEGHDYLVMEWIHGVPLDRHVKDHWPVSGGPADDKGSTRVRAILSIFIKVARAMEHAHGGSVIHRDLKPSNILIDEAGEPHIIDFGLARHEIGGRGVHPTMTEDFVGTRAYASPEQVSGGAGGAGGMGVLDGAGELAETGGGLGGGGGTDALRVTTDVYSLGVMLYEALTGVFPYPVEGRASEVDRHIQMTTPRPPRSINPAIADDLQTIVLKALSKSPTRRYPSAGQFGADLEAFLAGAAISAKRDSRLYVARCWARRNRRAIALVGVAGALAGTLLLVASAGVISSRVASARAEHAREQARLERERSEAMTLVAGAFGQASRASDFDVDAYNYAGGIKGHYGVRGLDRLRLSLMLGWQGGGGGGGGSGVVGGGGGAREGGGGGIASAATSSIAKVLRDTGREVLGEELATQVVMERLTQLGANYPSRPGDLHDLAEILLLRGQDRDAQRHAEEALALSRPPTTTPTSTRTPTTSPAAAASSSPEGHSPYEAMNLELLSRIALRQSDAPRALALVDEALAITRPIEPDSLEAAQRYATRSAALAAMGRWPEAETDLSRALKVRLALLPDEAPIIARSIESLAAIVEQHPTPTNNPPTNPPASRHPLAAAMGAGRGVATYADLGRELRSLAKDLDGLLSREPVVVGMGGGGNGKTSEPIDTLSRMLRLKEAMLGPNHRGLLSTIAALSIERQRLTTGPSPENAELLGRAVAIIEADPASSVIARANTLEIHALALLELGRHVEAFSQWERSIALWWTIPSELRDDRLAAGNERAMAQFMLIDGRYEQAEAHSRHVLEVIRPTLGPDHKIIAIAMAQRALALVHLGRADEGEREGRAAYAMSQRLGESRVPPDQALFNRQCLGLILIERERWAEARDLLAPEASPTAYISMKVPDRQWQRQRLAGLIRACGGLGDAEGQAKWQARLAELVR